MDIPTQDEYLKQLNHSEDELKKTLEIRKKTSSARMDLVEKLSEELVQDEELDKVKGLKGVEEEMIKYNIISMVIGSRRRSRRLLRTCKRMSS